MVADLGNKRLQVLDASFNHLMDIKEDGQGRVLEYPAHVAVNSKGEIIVSDYRADRVLVYDQYGAYSRDLLTGSWTEPSGIAVDRDDTLYIANGKEGSIKVINTNGEELRPISYTGRPGDYTYITIYNNKLIYCGDNGQVYMVDKYDEMDPDQSMLYIPVHTARGLAVDHSGDRMVLASEGHIYVVRGIEIERDIEEQAQDQQADKRGVAVTKTGEIVVANYYIGNLLVYDL